MSRIRPSYTNFFHGITPEGKEGSISYEVIVLLESIKLIKKFFCLGMYILHKMCVYIKAYKCTYETPYEQDAS